MQSTKETSEPRRKTKTQAEAAPAEESSESVTESKHSDAAVAESASLQVMSDSGATEAEPVDPLAPVIDSSAEASPDASAPPDRKRIEEQLEALKRREFELRRALAVADHPELAEAIRVLEGRAYAVTRVEAKMSQGLSKAEERRRETLDKKLASLRERRSELDAQISEIEAQLAPLGEERTRAFETERREALEQLIAAMSHHHDALHTAGLDAGSLVPEIARWMPEVVVLAEKLAVNATPR